MRIVFVGLTRLSNIHEYVALAVKKLLVVNLEPIVSKIRYGFEAATVNYEPLPLAML